MQCNTLCACSRKKKSIALRSSHGSDLMGFVFITGDKETIAQLRTEDEFVSVIVGVQLVHRNVRVVGAYTGAEMLSLFAKWDEQEEKLLAD